MAEEAVRTQEKATCRYCDGDSGFFYNDADLGPCACKQAEDRKHHDLKCWPEFFEALVDGRKRFEIRRNDRGFNVNDTITLHEWLPARGLATGRTIGFVINYVTDWEQKPGFVVLGIGVRGRE